VRSSRAAGSLWLLVEDGLQNECVKCGRATTQFELLVSEDGREYFHLKCYEPPCFLHLDEGLITTRTVYPENSRKLRSWTADHNNKLKFPFAPPTPALEAPPLQAVALALRLLKPREVLNAGSACRSWYASSWLDEAWGGSRADIFNQRRSACLSCAKVVREDTLGLLWQERPLCRTCRSSEEMQIVRVDFLCRAMGVDPRSCRTDMASATPQIHGHSVVFWADGLRRLAELRRKRRDQLVKILQHDEVLKEILTVELDQPITAAALSERGKQLSKYFMELKSKGWLAKQVAALDVQLTRKRRK